MTRRLCLSKTDPATPLPQTELQQHCRLSRQDNGGTGTLGILDNAHCCSQIDLCTTLDEDRRQKSKSVHNGLNELGQNYSREVESQLIRFIELMHQQNRVYNLTSIRDLDTMVSRHLLDSLSIAP